MASDPTLMAPRGSAKWRSVQQEQHIASIYGGLASPSSGGANSDSGDVRTTTRLIECKQTGSYEKPAKSISIRLADFEKIVDEAWAEGRVPMMALRIYSPTSVLADDDGNIDLCVYRIGDESDF